MSDYLFEGVLRSPDEIAAIATYRAKELSRATDLVLKRDAEIAELKHENLALKIIAEDEEERRDITRAEIERLEGALREARKAIESLDNDDLGYGQAADGHGDVYHWPLREELLSKINEALDKEPAEYSNVNVNDLTTALEEAIKRFQQLSCAMSNRIRSGRAFNKYEAIAERGEAICIAALAADPDKEQT